MSFERTANGLSNNYLFHSVDFVIYVEGKYEETNSDLVSYDHYFWKSVAEIVSPETKFKVLSRGGKQALLPIANEIISGNISNILVALDRDYDFECENALSHPRVIYTQGYSWENDVWSSEALMHLVGELNIGDGIQPERADELKVCISDFYRKAIRVARLNIAAMQNGMENIFAASKMRGLVELNGCQLPRFNREFFSATVHESTAASPIRMLSKVELTESHIQGHLMAHFGYHFVCRVLSILGQKASICADMLSTIAVNLLKSILLDCHSSKHIYYKSQFNNAVA